MILLALFIGSSPLIQENQEQFTKLISTVAGVNCLPILSDLSLVNLMKKDMISRTIEDCSVCLKVTGLINRVVELEKNLKKLKKVTDSLARLESNMKSNSYCMSAPAHVQETHRLKVATLRTELSQIQNNIKMLQSDDRC